MSKIADDLNHVKPQLTEIKTRAENSTVMAGYNDTGIAFDCKGKEGEAYFHVELPTKTDAEFFYCARTDVVRLCEIITDILSDELLMKIVNK